jgi:hypothetical protein
MDDKAALVDKLPQTYRVVKQGKILLFLLPFTALLSAKY